MRHTWAPPAALVGMAWVLAAGAGVWVALSEDPRGQVLIAVAAAALVLLALSGTLARPRLAADADGVTVRGLTRTRHWSWAQASVRLATHRRLGREQPVVEIDVHDRDDLVVLGWLDLGEDPRDVIESIAALRT
ncbi:PH (Pleckstrin Homology) domain-containing protein [Herbihabitans rhizosphaerae]|uniref:PH (Pleckstrin Homology) domain-containing protein n=1 Tax=Herbihabitans rhizosphaerae TaxID=1872711 RepID=A0A4Q7KPE2_9PSEU|nr:PH domain-containing protein [Herbihabitans rhizosphaerae]RZS37551.1 PH (Pleckstrin Homology) domain-containing protein [Herbihabitans rhizosphaerae]